MTQLKQKNKFAIIKNIEFNISACMQATELIFLIISEKGTQVIYR